MRPERRAIMGVVTSLSLLAACSGKKDTAPTTSTIIPIKTAKTIPQPPAPESVNPEKRLIEGNYQTLPDTRIGSISILKVDGIDSQLADTQVEIGIRASLFLLEQSIFPITVSGNSTLETSFSVPTDVVRAYTITSNRDTEVPFNDANVDLESDGRWKVAYAFGKIDQEADGIVISPVTQMCQGLNMDIPELSSISPQFYDAVKTTACDSIATTFSSAYFGLSYSEYLRVMEIVNIGRERPDGQFTYLTAALPDTYVKVNELIADLKAQLTA